MPRGARIAGWVYFPIHAVVLPLTLGMLLLAVLGELPSDITCNVVYYLCGLVFTLIAMWRFLRRSFDTMVGSILRCLGMMFAAYGIDVLLSLVLQLGTSLIGELPVPNNDAVTGLARTDYKRMIAVAVLMAPLVEECLFRGVVFGTIRPKSRFWAYAASIVLFSLYHVWQYVLVYQDPKLLLSALAYVPVAAALKPFLAQRNAIVIWAVIAVVVVLLALLAVWWWLVGRNARNVSAELLQLYFIAAADDFLSGLAEQLVHHILKLHPGLSRHFRLFPCLGVAARQQCNHTVAHIDLIVQETPLQEIKLPVQLGSHPVIR